jgi:uncharacterized protein (DUF1800 family)
LAEDKHAFTKTTKRMANYDDEIVEETTETPVEDDSLIEAEESEEVEEQEVEQIDWEARAKKAEAAIIKAKSKPKAEKTVAPKSDTKLSIFDQKALFKANIETQEDLDEILDYASRKNISVAEALKSTVIKATLAENAEIRNSALAVNTGTGRRSGGTVSNERLLADARSGKMPDSAEDIAKLARIRFGKK